MNYVAEYFAVIGATEKEINNGRRGSNPAIGECEGVLLDRFPEEDYADLPLPPHIWMFCFPDGIRFHTTSQNPTFCANVLTQGDGTRMYIASLIFYEQITPASLKEGIKDGIKNLGRDFGQRLRSLSASRDSSPSSSPTSFFLNATTIFAPKGICLISKFPLFSLFKDFLSHIYLLLMTPSNIPLERYIANFINEACFPTAGNVKLQITIGNEKIGTTIPSVKDLEIADFSFHYLFEVLDVENILQIIECILHEKKLLFMTSSTNSVLITFVIESIFSLLYPFGWPYVYVPVIPMSLLTFLEAPTPFILGVCKAQDLIIEDTNDIVKVDLDKNRLYGVFDTVPKLPNRNKLYHDIRAMVHPDLYNTGAILGSRRKGATDEDYLNVRRVFLDYFASLFMDWRSFILVMDDKLNEPTAIFNKASFLKAVPKDNLAFLEAFVQTYIFDSFIQEYQNVVSLNLFEETISKLKNVRERGRSISEKSGQAVTVVTRPNTDGLSSDIIYTYNSQFPRLTQKQFVPKVRPANKGLPHIKRRLGQGFDYNILFKAARASIPDDSEVSMFFLYYIVDKIFRSSSLEPVELSQLNDLLKEDNGRHQFAHLLQEHREKRSSNALQPAAFKLLASIMDTSLLEAEKADDFETCKILMNLGSAFFIKQDNGSMEFIRARLRKRAVWLNIDFWAYVLLDDIRQYHLNKDPEPEEVCVVQEKQQMDLANTIFGLIVNIAYSMVNMAIPGNVIMFYVHKMCEEYNLSDEHAQTLKKMIDKMCNFCVDSPQPDRVKTAFTPNSDPQPIFRSREGGGSTGGLRNKVVRRLIERSNSAPDLTLTPTSSYSSLPGMIEE